MDTGWTFYTPYSTTYANGYVILTALGAFIAGFSSILTALNFIVTIHTMRAPGLTWFRLPLFIWAHHATSIIIILGTPALGYSDCAGGCRAPPPRRHLRSGAGGRSGVVPALVLVLLHPAVYIMVLPSMGVVSELITCFSRKQIFGHTFTPLPA